MLLKESSSQISQGTYVELFAIIGEVHEVDVAIGREHDKVAEILSIFIALWRYEKAGNEHVRKGSTQKLTRLPFVLPLHQIIPVSNTFPLSCASVCVCT